MRIKFDSISGDDQGISWFSNKQECQQGRIQVMASEVRNRYSPSAVCRYPKLPSVQNLHGSPVKLALQQLFSSSGFGSKCLIWYRRSAERRQLAATLSSMPDEAIADLGLTRSEAYSEVAKPFWRA
jgi:uncharacterized protein YjiS (DUF1127 family)